MKAHRKNGVLMTSELLLPAGNMEKMKAAIRFGADAVYLSGKRFGMRAAADNFSVPELYEAADYAHKLGKKVYLTVNIMPHYYEYDALEKYFEELKESRIDALIIADVGVLELAKNMLPETEIHISTQAGAVSHRDCDYWQKAGAKRVVLARELSFDEIVNIRSRCSRELELECFIHGSMCVSWSGRCLLSNHFIGRDGNRGLCAQPCRWEYNLYEISEVKRPDMRFPIEESELGTFVMSSKDMCMIEHIPELIESGISSFKVEGRMKSAYYAAVCANTYRMAIDSYLKSPADYQYDPLWLRELESVTHREYCTGYYFDLPMQNAQTVTTPGYLVEKAYLATVEDYDPESCRATLVQKNKMLDNSVLECLTPGQVGRRVYVCDMKNEDGESIESAPHPMMKFSVRTNSPMKKGDILRMI